MDKQFKTQQETFWAGDFGNDYIQRNRSDQLLASNLKFFSNIFKNIQPPKSIIEFGANVGMNLSALKLLFPESKLSGIEINENASKELVKLIGKENTFNQSIFDYVVSEQHDISLIKGVLIHINPDMLTAVYEKLYNASSKYILIAEYYNPTPVSIPYRGHREKLFKRDFAGEMLDKYKELKLVDYGFAYKRDLSFPQDDITWFLLEKKQ